MTKREKQILMRAIEIEKEKKVVGEGAQFEKELSNV